MSAVLISLCVISGLNLIVNFFKLCVLIGMNEEEEPPPIDPKILNSMYS